MLDKDPHFQFLRWLGSQSADVRRIVSQDAQDFVLRDNEALIAEYEVSPSVWQPWHEDELLPLNIAFKIENTPVRPVIVLRLHQYCKIEYDSHRRLQTIHDDLTSVGYDVKLDRLRTILREGEKYAQLAMNMAEGWSPFDLPEHRSPTSFAKLKESELPRLVQLLQLTWRMSLTKRRMDDIVGDAVRKHMQRVKDRPVNRSFQERVVSDSTTQPTKRQQRHHPKLRTEEDSQFERPVMSTSTNGPTMIVQLSELRQSQFAPTELQDQSVYPIVNHSKSAHPPKSIRGAQSGTWPKGSPSADRAPETSLDMDETYRLSAFLQPHLKLSGDALLSYGQSVFPGLVTHNLGHDTDFPVDEIPDTSPPADDLWGLYGFTEPLQLARPDAPEQVPWSLPGPFGMHHPVERNGSRQPDQLTIDWRP